MGLRILELEDKLVASADVLQYKATHDELTGLLNRASIADLLRGGNWSARNVTAEFAA